jgi:hypothetical protein
MSYLRIARNKFWAWVVVSLLVGLGIGVGVMFMATTSNSDEVRTLRNQARDTASQIASVTAAFDAASAQNTQLTLDLETANARIATLEDSGGSTTPTDTADETPPIAMVSRTVSPSSVVASQNVNVTMTAKVTGGPTKVTMYLKLSSGTKKAYTLKRVTTGTTETWRLVTHAPTVKGTYTYWAVATKGTVSVDLPGATAGKLTVK